jgi:hypothetical protein
VTEENEENEDLEPSGGGVMWRFLVLGLALLALYVLSVGPAVRIHRRTKNARVRTTLELLYAPVERLSNTPLKEPLVVWIKLWEPNFR